MLKLSASFLNKPVLSLRTGAPIAQVYSALINPDNLKIEGFYCREKTSDKIKLLLYLDIREFTNKGFVVNDHDALSSPDELIRLADTIKINYQLIGKPIVTASKDKVGKVSDYAVEVETMYIQKIYASQSILKNFTGGSLSIDRSQILEITSTKIIINDLLKTSPIIAPATAI